MIQPPTLCPTPAPDKGQVLSPTRLGQSILILDISNNKILKCIRKDQRTHEFSSLAVVKAYQKLSANSSHQATSVLTLDGEQFLLEASRYYLAITDCTTKEICRVNWVEVDNLIKNIDSSIGKGQA